MLRNNRLKLIEDAIIHNGSVTVQKLSKNLKVTPETIRKDLEYLEKEGKLKRVYGGAILQEENTPETNATTRKTVNIKEKVSLAKVAPSFVEDGNFIALDDSTTNIEIAKKLAEQFHTLTCITNSLTIAQILAAKSSMRVLIASGKLNNEDLFTYGNEALEFISRYHPDIFFMSASGISLDEGIMDYGFDQFDVKMAMKKVSAKTFCVADNTKFGHTAIIRVSSLDEVDGIITDSHISSQWIKDLNDINVNLFFPENI